MYRDLTYKIHYRVGEANVVAASELPIYYGADYFDVVGIATINTIKSLGKGYRVFLKFTDNVTLIHSSNLVLPQGTNMDVAGGDVIGFVEFDIGKWICLDNPVKSSVLVSDEPYGSDWAGVTAIAPSKNAVYDKIQTIGTNVVSDEAYGTSWNDVTDIAPSKNAVYDKFVLVDASIASKISNVGFAPSWAGITTIGASKNALYYKFIAVADDINAKVNNDIYGASWDGVTTIAPSKNAVYDKFVSVDAAINAKVDNEIYGAAWDGVIDVAPSKNAVYDKIQMIQSDLVSNDEYSVGWDGVTNIAPSKNAVYDKVESISNTLSTIVSDETYGPTWNGVTDIAPSKNAVYDKIQTIQTNVVSDETYGPTWDGVTNIAPSKNAVYDKIQTIQTNVVSDETYGPTWNGVTDIAPSKNAVYDKINTFTSGVVSDEAFSSTWDGVIDIAPSKNAVYDEVILKAEKGVNYDITRLNGMSIGGNPNVAIGDFAVLWSITTGYHNIGMGYAAGNALTTGSNNIALGTDALRFLDNGSFNIAIGNSAGAYVSSSSAICIGNGAGSDIFYSGAFVAIGDNTLNGTSVSAADYSVAIGYNTAYYTGAGTYTRYQSVMIGARSCQEYDNSIDQGIFIGYNSSPSTNGSSVNEINIGTNVAGRGANTTSIGNTNTLSTYLYGETQTDSIVTGQINSDLINTPAVKFPSVVVDSSDPNTIDDYEEGTFTPFITLGGSEAGVTYDYRHGAYTKIGNVVNFTLKFKLIGAGSTVGVTQIGGLPFDSASVPGQYYSHNIIPENMDAPNSPPVCYQGAGVSYLRIGSLGTNYSMIRWESSNIVSGMIITISGAYNV